MASQELNQALWNAANVMRSTMSADEYKDYLLGLVFYKYLSDRQLYAVVDLLEDRKPENLDEAQKIYEEARDGEDWEDLQAELSSSYGFAIEPKYTFTALYNEINDKTFTTDHLRQAMRDVEQGGEAIRGQKPYEDLFEDFDIDSKSLGTTPAKRNAMLSDVMKELAHIDFTQYGADALGDAYEYLIGQFAAGSGKKAGEFYTPQAVAELITRIVTKGKEGKPGFSIYDKIIAYLIQANGHIKPAKPYDIRGFAVVQDQLYLFAEQVHRLKTLERYGVEYAVCDSPLPLNIIYNSTPDELFDQLVMHEHAKFDNVEYLLRRNDEFISIDGRKETNLERAKEKDEEIKAVLDGAGIGYTVISPWETDKVLGKVVSQKVVFFAVFDS